MRYCVVQRYISHFVYHTFKLVPQLMSEELLQKLIFPSFFNVYVQLRSSLLIFEIIAKIKTDLLETSYFNNYNLFKQTENLSVVLVWFSLKLSLIYLSADTITEKYETSICTRFISGPFAIRKTVLLFLNKITNMSGQTLDKTKMFADVNGEKGAKITMCYVVYLLVQLCVFVYYIFRYFIKFIFVEEYDIDGIEMKNDQIIDMLQL